MSEKPIIFSGPMVKAILEGRKTMTRRVVQPKAPFVPTDEGLDIQCALNQIKCPYGIPGDHLWVRETFCPMLPEHGGAIAYLAESLNKYGERDGDSERCRVDLGYKWKPSIHMFRKDSRITLEVTAVRVERVQGISYQDILDEGWNSSCSEPFTNRTAGEDAHDWYKTLWDFLNAKRGYSWDSNPWVWVISFKKAGEL